MKRSSKKAWGLILVLALAAGALCLHLSRTNTNNGELRFFGNVDIRQVQLSFHDTGRIACLLAKEGDRVVAGQLLAEIDPSRYRAAAARTEAQWAAQQAVVSRLVAGSRPEEIAEAKARVAAAGAALKDTEQRKARIEKLTANQYVSQQLIDEASTAVDTAQANLTALQKVAEVVVLGPRQEDIAAAQAQLQAAQATLTLTRQELADTKLYAPTNGIIENRILEIGDMAFPKTPVFTLALTDPVWVRTYVPEPDLGKLTPGMSATVTTDSFPGKTYPGWIGYISPTAEFTPKQIETTDLRARLVYQVRVFVPNPDNELKLGMPATVTVPTREH
ncbi:MAG: efflux RND transporter periplasmic adaptor subunit [bacterium]